MIRLAAASFPASVYDPPPESTGNTPSLNLNLGGVNVSLGGPGGTGVYRTSGDAVGVQADGIREPYPAYAGISLATVTQNPRITPLRNPHSRHISRNTTESFLSSARPYWPCILTLKSSTCKHKVQK